MILLTAGMINSLGYHHPEALAANWSSDSKVFKTFSNAVKKLGNKDKESKQFKGKLERSVFAWRLIFEGEEGNVAFRRIATYDFDPEPTMWDMDPYPNGVHSLPFKDELRTGGRLKIFVDEKNRDSFFWRANQTLTMFQWRIEKDKNVETEGKPILEFSTGLPVYRIQAVMKGLSNDLLKSAHRKQFGVSADLCFSLQGPSTEDHPNGIDFSLKAKTKAERDEFVDWLVEWRDACSYG